MFSKLAWLLPSLNWLRANILVIAWVVAVTLAGAFGWHEKAIRADLQMASFKAEIAASQRIQAQANYAKARASDARIAKLQKQIRDLTHRINHELQNSAYSCAIPDSGRVLLNEADRAGNKAIQP